MYSKLFTQNRYLINISNLWTFCNFTFSINIENIFICFKFAPLTYVTHVLITAYDFTGRQQHYFNRSPRQTTDRESFHFPASDNRDYASAYSDVTPFPEGRNAKSSRRAKLPSEFQETVPEEQTEYNLPAGSEEARYLSPQAIAKISETLGAINTVGRYLVNYTRGTTDDRLDSPQSYPVSKYIFIGIHIKNLSQ